MVSCSDKNPANVFIASITGCHLSFLIGFQSQEVGSYIIQACLRADTKWDEREARAEEEESGVLLRSLRP